MEILNKRIEQFLKVDYGYGDGYDYGHGDGYGSGSGSGYGSCSVYGSGSGSGYGSCSGDGSGDGSGVGYGAGYGFGHGYDYGIAMFGNNKVYYIDGIPTVIENVFDNLARGYVINKDLTTTSCYIVKGNNMFAHGNTLDDARIALQSKIFERMDVDEKIDIFIKEFDISQKYSAKTFYDWHHKLTGSCEFGRNEFVKNHGIDLENGIYTVEEFVRMTKDDFGGDVIKQLAERLGIEI